MSSTQNLHRYATELLTEGLVVPVDVFDDSGRRLLTAGSRLETAILKAVRRACSFEFWTADPWPSLAQTPDADTAANQPADDAACSSGSRSEAEPEQQIDAQSPGRRTVSVGALRVGMRLAHPLYDERGILLLAANATITSRFISLLRQRDLETVLLRPAEGGNASRPAESAQNALTEMLDARLEELTKIIVRPSDVAWHTSGALSPGALREQARSQLAHYECSADLFEKVATQLMQGSVSGIDSTDEMLNTFLDSIALDLNIIPHVLALRTTPGEYLYRHCLNASLLSMTIAAQMRYPRTEVLKAGLAALLHDIGMLRVDASIRLAPRTLTPEEYLQIQSHPMHTLNLLERCEKFDPVLLLATYQVHERCDRSGYPRGRHQQYVQPLARIISIADAYCAMTCPRPHRQALKPYEAMAAILAETKIGYFDTASIRALLDCISLYPIGSRVLLNSAQQARVIRAVPGRYDRPTVTILDPDGNETQGTVELKEHHELQVVKVLN